MAGVAERTSAARVGHKPGGKARPEYDVVAWLPPASCDVSRIVLKPRAVVKCGRPGGLQTRLVVPPLGGPRNFRLKAGLRVRLRTL